MTRSNWLILGLAVLAASLGGYIEHRQRPPDNALTGQPLPTIRLSDLAGKTHALGDYHGGRVLFNFWASWCGPCLDEMPALNRAQGKFGERGAIVVGIAMDDPPLVRNFLAAHPLDYPILLGDLTDPSTTQRLGDSTAVLPYSVLVGPDGRVLATHAGALSTDDMTRWLEPDARPQH